ncbi:MAG: dUTP diphosphatase [Methylococcales bacterium]|jgi:hypothetical protein|nr:dUTP diphosphatase [Methylococcales bacterium]MBT7444882.1 dUTP diphosphatase [Methylococcales bacterium]
MKEQMLTMLSLQNDMNSKVHADWMNQGFDWTRAIWTESAEMLEHYGWKWWKKFNPDMPQVQLEVVDIWHFGMSHLLQTKIPIEDIATTSVNAFAASKASGDLRVAIESLAAKAVAEKTFDIDAFAVMLVDSEMTFDDLYRQYVGKNVLNFFRQDHGYKDGSYIKQWQGREDNEHLVEVMAEMDLSLPNIQQQVYSALESRYPS